VELVAEGPEGSLQSLLTFLKTGPALAKVTAVEANWTSASKAQYQDFQIKR
jgi:acylphosphatase